MVKGSNQKYQVMVDMETHHEVCEDHWYAASVTLADSVEHKHGDVEEVVVATSPLLTSLELVKAP